MSCNTKRSADVVKSLSPVATRLLSPTHYDVELILYLFLLLLLLVLYRSVV